jgi:hypothetical protein
MRLSAARQPDHGTVYARDQVELACRVLAERRELADRERLLSRPG